MPTVKLLPKLDTRSKTETKINWLILYNFVTRYFARMIKRLHRIRLDSFRYTENNKSDNKYKNENLSYMHITFLYCSDYEKLTLKFYVETENFQNYLKRIITDHKLLIYVKINTLRNIFDNIYIKPYMETVTCLVQLWLNGILMIWRLVK